MEIILSFILIPIALLILVMITSKGECYYCGHRLKGDVCRLNKKKYCGECLKTVELDKFIGGK